MYAIIKHGHVLATGTLEGMFISNIFPLSDTPEWKAAHDVYEVVFPEYNPETQQLVQAAPVISGRTVMLHTVMDRPPPPEPQAPPTSEPEPEPELTTNTSGADTAI
jgi:hypothetical protein